MPRSCQQKTTDADSVNGARVPSVCCSALHAKVGPLLMLTCSACACACVCKSPLTVYCLRLCMCASHPSLCSACASLRVLGPVCKWCAVRQDCCPWCTDSVAWPALVLRRDASQDTACHSLAYAIPSPQALQILSDHAPVIEIGAGTGEATCTVYQTLTSCLSFPLFALFSPSSSPYPPVSWDFLLLFSFVTSSPFSDNHNLSTKSSCLSLPVAVCSLLTIFGHSAFYSLLWYVPPAYCYQPCTVRTAINHALCILPSTTLLTPVCI